MKTEKLSKEVLEKLRKQLAATQARRERLSGYPGADRSQFSGLMREYESGLRLLVSAAVPEEKEDTTVPFVVVGSEVEVCEPETGETMWYRITTPEAFEAGGEDVTLLSPVGKGLLLKRAGDCVDIQVPAGVIRYEIRSIRLSSALDLEDVFAQVN